MTPSISIVLPCYNPAKGWENNVIHNYNLIQSTFPEDTIEIVLVNDCSSVKILANEISELNSLPYFQYIDLQENKGKGNAVRIGTSRAQAPLIIYTDVDFPYDLDSLIRVIKTLKSGADVVVGERNNEYYVNKMPFSRKIISRFTRFFFLSFLNLPVSDTQCGLKGYGTKGKIVFLKTKIDRFLFDMEFLVLCQKEKSLNVKPVTVHLNPNIIFSKMPLKVLFQELLNFWIIIKIKFFSK